MSLGNEVVLRPRFKLDLKEDNEAVLSRFELEKTTQSELVVSRIDNHVFIRIPKKEQHFWSPQLHLEIVSFDKGTSVLRGLFGPNPTVWTMFMFFHFALAVLFIAFCIWGYTNYSLNNSYFYQSIGAVFMILFWVVLYIAGRIGKTASKDEMIKLNNFMKIVLNKKSSKII